MIDKIDVVVFQSRGWVGELAYFRREAARK